MKADRYDYSPFGGYIADRLSSRAGRTARSLFTQYKKMASAKSIGRLVTEACSTCSFIDDHFREWPALLGGSVTPFSIFRGYFLEEVTLRLARLGAVAAGFGDQVEVVKLPTGDGIITGVSLAFRRGKLPKRVPVVFRRDREDVVVGFRRTLTLNSKGGNPAIFPDELIPIAILACKIYIDATRLENVLAKARSFSAQYSSCRLLVVAEWDALGQGWHDRHGRVLDSLFSPVERLIFLRGEDVRRPPNNQLARSSRAYPYRHDMLRSVARSVKEALQEW